MVKCPTRLSESVRRQPGGVDPQSITVPAVMIDFLTASLRAVAAAAAVAVAVEPSADESRVLHPKGAPMFALLVARQRYAIDPLLLVQAGTHFRCIQCGIDTRYAVQPGQALQADLYREILANARVREVVHVRLLVEARGTVVPPYAEQYVELGPRQWK
uniref:Uncharacterized protein n=1 Tax=Anopheles farauti TaxID=69004 RepID=A0A182QBM5_9DIPT